ncbi:MAG: hypothetical protein ACFFAO_15880, partial [Candidatus Hermodarchaeota archaeon]
MSEEIEKILKNYDKVIVGRKDEIGEYLIKNFEDSFKSQAIINVKKTDATKRIKDAGFHKNLSSWRNIYGNIVISSCELIKGKEKRYDYKFFFVEEKLDEKKIEVIKNALADCNKLQEKFQFDEAIAKIDEMIHFIRRDNDEIFNKRLFDRKKELISAKEDYEKGMEKIRNLEKIVQENRAKKDLVATIENCEKIIQIADSIKKFDIKRKYDKILNEAEIELKIINEISKLEKQIHLNETNENFEKAFENCEKILRNAKSIDNQEIIEKYTQKKKEFEEKISLLKEQRENSLNRIEELEKSLKANQESQDYDSALVNCEEIIQILNEIKDYDLIKKYESINDEIQKNIIKLKEIEELENQFKSSKDSGDLLECIKISVKIINISKVINHKVYIEKYSGLKLELEKEIREDKEKYDQTVIVIEKLVKEFESEKENGELESALDICEKIIDLNELIDDREAVITYTNFFDQIKNEL